MIRKRYLVFLLIILVLFAGGCALSPYLDWYMIPQKCSDRELILREEEASDTDFSGQYLWFTYEGDNIVLHYLPEAVNFSKIRWLDLDEQYHECPLEDFVFDDTMAGTFIVTADAPLSLDTDGDGTKETVWLTAKTDTNACKTFYGNYHYFGQADIPLELVVDRTFADVLLFGEPYTGSLHVESSYGMDEDMDIDEGYLSYISYKDSGAGLMMFTLDTGTEKLICSYTQESNLLNTQHLRALSALGILLLVTILLIIILYYVKKLYASRIY